MRAHRLVKAFVAGFVLLQAGIAAAGSLVELTVVNRSTGERLTPYRHGGQLYVAGTPGQPYAVELRNRSGERLLTVVSVDGVNVLTGETAATRQSGYVLDGGRRYAINGWRKSLDEVAQFVFTALPDSYAARTGRPQNVGVIGVAVFRERPVAVVAPAPESWRDAAGNAGRLGESRPAAPAAKAESATADRLASRSRADVAEAQPRLGTGHGEREHSPTRSTEFARAADTPDEILSIRYDSRANLVARGIIPTPRIAEPQPFPAGFVPDPKG